MPRKSKRKLSVEQSLKHAREVKKRRADEGEFSRRPAEGDLFIRSSVASTKEPEGLQELLDLSIEALYTDNEDVDPSFDLDASLRSDTSHMAGMFCEDWITSLSWENRASFGLFFTFSCRL